MLPEVGHVAGHDDLCRRCAEVLDRGAVPLAAASRRLMIARTMAVMMLAVAGLAVAAVVALLDQLSKPAVLHFFGETGCAAHHLPVTWFFDLVLTCNTGISFGLFNRSGVGSLVFAVAGAAIIVVLLFWLAGCAAIAGRRARARDRRRDRQCNRPAAL